MIFPIQPTPPISSSNRATRDTWDYENQNTQVEQPAGQLFTYVYNNDLLKVAYRDDLDVITSYVWDKKNVIQETDDTAVVQVDYTHEPLEHGNLVSQRRFGETTFHHYDALGSTSALSDAAQVVSDE